MNAFEMFARCAIAQWRGYSEDVRAIMEAEFQSPHGAPARVVAPACRVIPLWSLDHGLDKLRPVDLLISLKEDIGA